MPCPVLAYPPSPHSRFGIIAGLLAAAICVGPEAQAAEVSGPARVIDGDTLDIGSTRVCLFGIDAPEAAQACKDARGRRWSCGEAAEDRLERLVAGRSVSCVGRGTDDYGRLLAVCAAGGRELSGHMVRAGLAWAFVKYAPDYVEAEREARVAKRGVFAAENEPPWTFREAKWNSAIANAPADRARACPIKGNVSSSGERIYHLPWQRDYARVEVNEKAGERWFCDEGEAERAGWRRAAR
jgi:endonuclease YncB( thermonuclease family)